MKKFNGYYCKNKKGLGDFKPLFGEWIKALEKYEELTGGDQAYWCTEMTNVSVLAGAAWKYGYAAICEIPHEKGAKNSPKKFWGRADLYIHSGKKDYFIEAKYEELSLDFQGKLSNRLQKTMDVALVAAKGAAKAAKTNPENKGEHRALAIVFYTFYLPVSKKEIMDTKIREHVDALDKGQPFHAAGWFFPSSQRVTGDEGYYYPGVIMAVQNPSVR